MIRFVCSALAVLSLLAAQTSPAMAATAKAPAGDAFYKPPSPLTGKAHGDVIWARNAGANRNTSLAGAARNLLVLYRSTGVAGPAVGESGAVAIPKGTPPKGGWPVLAWAHGTTGLADSCAPTRLRRSSTNTNDTKLRAQLGAYLKSGYAVAFPDYEGLGTPGVHPYLVGRSEGRSVLDMVRAARKIDPRIGKSVAIIGHSQGGHASLWATFLAPSYTPELKIRGTVLYAPASHIKDQSGLLDSLTTPNPLSALIASIFRGADAAYPQLKIRSLLTDKAAALYPSVDEKCLGELSGSGSFGGLAPSELLREGTDRGPLLAAADKSDPENLAIKTPLLIAQGGDDGTVFPVFTDQLVDELKQKGAKVTYKKYPGIDHGGIPEAGRKTGRAFLKTRVGR